MSDYVIGVDVDGTIWSPYDLAADAINRMTNNKYGISLNDMVHYDSFIHIAGSEIAYAGFREACSDPDVVLDRIMYPGVAEAINELYDMGVRTHFITHNPRPRIMRPALAMWFKEYFDVPFGLTITETGNKVPLLRRAKAFGIIDDRPKTIEEVLEGGMFCATIRQPWNEEILLERPEVVGFDHWDEVPALVKMELESVEDRVSA